MEEPKPMTVIEEVLPKHLPQKKEKTKRGNSVITPMSAQNFNRTTKEEEGLTSEA